MTKDWTGNGGSIFTTLGASNHTDKEREQHDFYATSPKAIDSLAGRHYNLPSHVWECACGRGDLSERLQYYGVEVTSTDLIYRGYGKGGVDFLEAKELPSPAIDGILTNPPYKYALAFVLHALELLQNGQQCIMFLKTTFLEGKERRKRLYSLYPPKVIYQFSERVLCAKNAEFERMKRGGGSAVAYAWFVWEKGYKGDTIIKWI